MKKLLNEILTSWWVEAGLHLSNPKSNESVEALKKVLREDFRFENEVISYLVERLTNSPTNFHLGGKSSGINVGDNQTAVSAKLHPDWDEGDDNDEDDIFADGGIMEWDVTLMDGLDELTDDGEATEEKEQQKADEPEFDKSAIKGMMSQAERDKLKKEAIDDKLLKTQLKNPTTGNMNQVDTLLGKKKKDPAAYKVGKDFLGDKGVDDEEIENAADTNKKDDKSDKPKQTADEAYESAKQKVKELYGDDGKLLQNSETSDAALNNGYQEGADWVAPGNAGSNFNENMSNEAALIIKKYPDISESELASIIFEKSRNTKLGKQQKSTTVESPSKKDRGEIPSSISKDDKNLYKASIIAARSGITKSKRATEGTKLAQEKVGFGSETKTTSFGGTTKDLENLKSKIDSAEKIYVTDEGRVIEVPKDVMLEWVAGSGGGENASDTAVITEDENGNLIYDGWSDKKGFNDIQGNSTLNDDYTKQSKNIDNLANSGRVSKEDAKRAKAIVEESKKLSAEIEKNYSKASFQEGKFLGTYKGEDKARLVDHLKKQEDGYKNAGTKNHIADAMKQYKVESHEELLDKLSEEATSGKSSANRLKIISRLAGAEKSFQTKNGNEIPDGLDTNKIISNAREQALSLQRKTQERLNEITAKTSTGKEKPLGDVIGFQETIDFLHLDKIKEADEGDFKQVLKRNTQLVMAGKDVPPKSIKECLGVDNLKDAEDNFEVVQDEEYFQNAEKTVTTGKVVYIYAVNQKDGNRKFLGTKRYRSKEMVF
jgi:hypothetical protein